MTVVVDASVLVAAVADAGSDGVWAEEVVADGDLIAPHLALVEATNILRKLELAGALDRSDARTAFRDLQRLAVELVSFAVFAERVWQLRANVTSYYAWYVAIAEAFDVPLATLDGRLVGTAGPRCEFLSPP